MSDFEATDRTGIMQDTALMDAHNVRDSLTRKEVVAAYELFLDRKPESEAVVDEHLSACRTIAELHSRMMSSIEYRRRALDSFSHIYVTDYDPSEIEVEADESALNQLIKRVETVWSALGEDEPYWSVSTYDIFRRAGLDDHRIEQFYRSGSQDFLDVENAFRRNGLTPSPAWSILDLGCGLGRVAEHFSSRYAAYTGIDISASHLRIADERAIRIGRTNQRFMFLRDFIRATEISYDLFFSLMTLQHNSPPIITWLLRQCLERVKPGGFAFFQVPCHLSGYRFSVREYLMVDPNTSMEMHAIPQRQIVKLLNEKGFQIIELLPYPKIGPCGFSFMFFAQRC
jgi:SAM-dependent methyltransferase